MTNYSPLMDALDETGEPVTVADMVNVGYSDYAQGEGPRIHILSALHALDGQIFDDPAKWHIVNELVGALAEMDTEDGVTTEISLEGSEIHLSYEPDGSINR